MSDWIYLSYPFLPMIQCLPLKVFETGFQIGHSSFSYMYMYIYTSIAYKGSAGDYNRVQHLNFGHTALMKTFECINKNGI